MQVSDYQFFRIVATCDKLVKDLLPLLKDLRTSERLAYTVYVLDHCGAGNVSIAVGISRACSESVISQFAYIGYVLGRYDMVPEVVSQFSPPADVDLTSPSCFMDNLPF